MRITLCSFVCLTLIRFACEVSDRSQVSEDIELELGLERKLVELSG